MGHILGVRRPATAAATAAAAVVVVAGRPELPAQPSRPRALGRRLAALESEEASLAEAELEALLEGVLRITKHGERGEDAKGTAFAGAFPANTYTFELVATLDGLAQASQVLGVPVDPFLDRALDASCNVFLLNAVVIEPSTVVTQSPWQGFAIAMHIDDSLAAMVRRSASEALPRAGAARSVAVLFLAEPSEGGQLEVYNATPFSPKSLKQDVEAFVAHACRQEDVHCAAAAVDVALAGATLGRLEPRRGRLARFDGAYAHAVRRLGSGSPLRVSLVLEQFAYPEALVARVPTVWSSSRGRPLFADAALAERYVDAAGRLRFWGSPNVRRGRFQACLRAARLAARPPASGSVRGCLCRAGARCRAARANATR